MSIWQPYEYQKHAGMHIRDNKFSGLFLDMGLGKTVITLTEIEWLIYQNVEVERVLVIGPKQVIRSVWKQEAEKWAHLSHLKVSIVWGTVRERLNALKVKADIYLINRENLVWLVNLFQTGWPFDMVVVDELSSFKNHASQRFRALRIVRPYIDRLVGLTGTPAPNGLLDLWSQMYLLDEGARLGKNITGYRNRYFVAQSLGDGFISKYVLRPEAKENIYSKIGDICISMKAKDYLDLPPLITNDIFVDLDPLVMTKYRKFKDDCILELINTEITALNAGALTNKLLQFSNGAIYHSDNPKDYSVVHDEKLEVLQDIMDEAQGGNVLVFYSFRHDLERIKRKFPSIRQLKTPQDIDDWNAGKIPMMIAHPASAGHGLNLQQGGHIMVWFGLNWSLELYQQAVARIMRQGQIHSVIMHRIISRGTKDMDVVRSLASKDAQQNDLMLAVKADIEEYRNRRRVA